MVTSTNDEDWGFAIYNEAGVDLVNFGLFTPKYIGKLHLSLPEGGGELNNLRVVSNSGREVSVTDGSLNVPFMSLMERGREPDRASGALISSYLFTAPNNGIRMVLPLYGSSGIGVRTRGLIPAVIHGWGSGYSQEKFEMATLMCNALKSGSDIMHASLEMKHIDGLLSADDKSNYATGLPYAGGRSEQYNPTGLPITASFRSTSIGTSEVAGFSAVSLGCGYMVIDMAGGTDLEVYFYETAGLPYEYLNKCSTAIDYNPYGLASYDYSPQQINYVMPKKGSVAEVNDGYNRSVTFSDLVVGKVDRSRWFFTTKSPETVPAIIDALRNGENKDKRKKLARFLEGDENAPLKYEQYDSSSLPLKLMGAVTQNGGTVKRRVSGVGLFYEVSGIDLSKAAQPVGMLGWDNAALYKTGLPDGFGAGVHSLFQSKQDGSSYYPMLPNPQDTFKWDLNKVNSYQPILNYRYSNVIADKSDGGGLTGWQKVNADLANTFNARMASNLPYSYRQFNKAQSVAHVSRSKEIVWASYTNPLPGSAYYDAATRAAESQAMQLARQTEARLEEVSRAFEERLEAELLDSEINAFKSKMGLLEQLSKIANENTSRSWQDPFWGAWAYRHSDKLELYCAAREALPETTTPLPENWLCCVKPDV
ncbi:MAG: hypothetical protein D8H97_25935 [Neisseria sp.]|nr:MAG: hypothetical protein D8H97_25935 [Neisseria sp.]